MLNRGEHPGVCLGVLAVLPTLPTDNTGDSAPNEAILPEARLKAGRLGSPSPPRDPWRSDHAWTTSHGECLGAPSFAYGDSGVEGMALMLRASLECFHSVLTELVREPRKEDAGIDSSSTSKGCKGCEASRSVDMRRFASPAKQQNLRQSRHVWGMASSSDYPINTTGYKKPTYSCRMIRPASILPPRSSYGSSTLSSLWPGRGEKLRVLGRMVVLAPMARLEPVAAHAVRARRLSRRAL